MLEFNNFRMVNAIELVSKSQNSQSLRSLKVSEVFNVSCSLLMFTLIRRFQGTAAAS